MTSAAAHFDEELICGTSEIRGATGSQVCENCRDEHYTYCDECEEYWPEDDCVSYIDGED